MVALCPPASQLYVVACDKHDAKGITLFLVDRTRQRASFWSDRLTEVFIFNHRGAAERKAASLKFNNPRVMTLEQARWAATSNRLQKAAYDFDDDYIDAEGAEWDAHKAFV